MASLQQKGNGWYCQFLYHGKRHTFSVGPVSAEEAETKASQVDYLLMRLKQRLAVLPPGVGIVEYLQFDGHIVPPESPELKTLRLSVHSYCSALAAKGVDQRIIDDIMGHQTEDMRRRYRHLLPSLKQDAVASVFG